MNLGCIDRTLARGETRETPPARDLVVDRTVHKGVEVEAAEVIPPRGSKRD